MAKKLKGALAAIKEEFADFTSLEVVSFTGDVEAIIGAHQGQAPAAEGGEGDAPQPKAWSEIFNEIKAADAVVGGKFNLRLYTHISIDGDTVLFQSQTAPSSAIVEAHDSAVKAGIATRASIMGLFKDIINLG